MKEALKSLADKLPLRKRATIETINDKLKNIARVKHSRYRTFDYFIVNLLSANAAYCCFPQNCVSMLWELLTHNKFSAFITAPTYSPIFLNVNHDVKGLWRIPFTLKAAPAAGCEGVKGFSWIIGMGG